MRTRTIASAKTYVHFVVESCETGTLISRYEHNEMLHMRHVPDSFEKAVEAAQTDLQFFAKNPLTRIQTSPAMLPMAA